MPPAGDDLIAVWREAGEWWMDEPPREFRRFVSTSRGIREEEKVLGRLSTDFGDPQYMSIRALKVQDNKVEKWTTTSPSPMNKDWEDSKTRMPLTPVPLRFT